MTLQRSILLVLTAAGLGPPAVSAAQRPDPLRQQQLLLDLVEEYVGNMDEGHAKARMNVGVITT